MSYAHGESFRAVHRTSAEQNKCISVAGVRVHYVVAVYLHAYGKAAGAGREIIHFKRAFAHIRQVSAAAVSRLSATHGRGIIARKLFEGIF